MPHIFEPDRLDESLLMIQYESEMRVKLWNNYAEPQIGVMSSKNSFVVAYFGRGWGAQNIKVVVVVLVET